MKFCRWFIVVFFVVQAIPVITSAQTTSQAGPGNPSSPPPEEKKLGDYVVQQSFEFGYRAVDVSSQKLNASDPTSFAMYDTFVNQHTGPRLLEQTLSLQSPDHSGLLFDDLFVTSFGFGGDPNNVARAQISKYKWYDFNALFRRDWNYFDYNLLANPLNPSTSTPTILINSSPHRWDSVRRMTDLGLTLLPQSRISIRVGYNRNISEGPSSTTIPEASDDEPIETRLAQHNRMLSAVYQFGVDFKVLPRTNISYDQTISHTHNDNSWRDESFPWVLSNGTPADLGISWDTLAGSPCTTPFIPAPPNANEACSLYLAYSRSDHMRAHTPTEQLSFQSNYFRRLNLSGRISYSNLDFSGPFNDFFNGFYADSGTRQFTTTGPMKGNRISVSADIGGTFQITNKLRISDRFRFYNFRTPAQWNATTSTWLGTSALTPVGPTPDSVDNTIFAWFLGQNTKSNEINVEYDFSKHLGGNLGYRFRQMTYHHTDNTNDVTTGDVSSAEDFVDVNFHTALLGVWFRPSNKLRANFDAELTTADNFLTRISPRRLQQYRARARYQPVRWITLSATGNIYEARNGIQEISYNAHTRNFGFTATANRNDRFGVELAYNYNNVGSNAFICFQDTASSIPGNPFPCAADTEGGAPFETYQTYSNRNHFGTASFLLKPVKRLTTNVGYSIVRVNGDATTLNPLQPFGSLRSTFHRPLADVQFEIAPKWTAIARWNYYEYAEQNAFFGPTYPRGFHANATTLSLRYAF